MPWIVHWPAGLGTEARTVDGLVEMVDMLPTLLELAGAPVHPAMAGRSYADGLRGDGDIPTRKDVYAVHRPGHLMLRDQRFKYLRYVREQGPEEKLYDLREDPWEFENVAEDRGYAEELRGLRERAFARTIEATGSIRPRRLRF
jgi:arylsulfatase A-like enzyme